MQPSYDWLLSFLAAPRGTTVRIPMGTYKLPLLVEEGDDLLDLPDVIGDASGHRGGTGVGGGEAHMRPSEVVVHEVQRHGSGKVLDLAGERIGEARETPHAHAHGEVLALDV